MEVNAFTVIDRLLSKIGVLEVKVKTLEDQLQSITKQKPNTETIFWTNDDGSTSEKVLASTFTTIDYPKGIVSHKGPATTSVKFGDAGDTYSEQKKADILQDFLGEPMFGSLCANESTDDGELTDEALYCEPVIEDGADIGKLRKYMSILERLALLPDGYRERAVSQYNKDFATTKDHVDSMWIALDQFADRNKTKEGIGFWGDVERFYDGRNKDLPPLPDNEEVVTNIEESVKEESVAGNGDELRTLVKEITKTEWLELLPGGYRERALDQYDERFRDKSNSHTMADAIFTFSNRGNTKEGREFWCKVRSYYGSEEESLPPLPDNKEVVTNTEEPIQETPVAFDVYGQKDMTVSERLKLLPDGYRERAIEQIDRERVGGGGSPTTMSSALYAFCVWSNTEEGNDFRSQVEDHYYNPEKHPALPPLPGDTKEEANEDINEEINEGFDIYGKKDMPMINRLELLPDGYRERAISQCENKEKIQFSMEDAILGFSEWIDTDEGFDFRSKVRGCYCNPTQNDLPPLP